jgi:predicted metal-dependent hydrolase
VAHAKKAQERLIAIKKPFLTEGLFKMYNVIMKDKITYFVKKSRRARRMRISVSRDMAVTLVLPFGFNPGLADRFIRQKTSWIKKSLDYFRRNAGRVVIKSSRKDYLANRKAALELAKNKVEQWSLFYGFGYNRVSVKNQKSRWGSCSRKGNLNFNYKIVHLPEKLVDYLVVHEVCHLKELNHSRNFWTLVARAFPDYKILRKQLRNFSTLE